MPDRDEAEYQDSARHDRFDGFDAGDRYNPSADDYNDDAEWAAAQVAA
jgi:hypothetical protein